MDVIGHSPNRRGSLEWSATAETAQVRGDDAKFLLQLIDLRLPHLPVQRKTVKQDHRLSFPHVVEFDTKTLPDLDVHFRMPPIREYRREPAAAPPAFISQGKGPFGNPGDKCAG